MDVNDIAFYVVQNNEGEFFRRKGYGGSGDTWVKGLGTARVWTNISGARSTVTFFANRYPKYPPPKIIKLTVAATETIDETERIAAARERKRKKEENRELWVAQERLKQAQDNLERAKVNLARERQRRKG